MDYATYHSQKLVENYIGLGIRGTGSDPPKPEPQPSVVVMYGAGSTGDHLPLT